MRERFVPQFATDEAAVEWMDAPERHLTSWRNEGALGAVDDLLIVHGLEVVIETYQGDPYVVIEARAK